MTMVEVMSNSKRIGGLILGGAALIVSAVLYFYPGAEPVTEAKAQAKAETREAPASSSQVVLSYSSVVKRVSPAVVNVYSKRTVQARGMSPFANDPFFQRFFGDRFSFGVPRERVQQSLGSGVIVDANGLIVTNNHVVQGGDEYKIALNDRREFEAKLVLSDERTDLAVLKIDTKGEKLPFLEFKDSDSVEVGDMVLAIGNPFGVGQTVTTGIVSALARTHVGVSDYQFFIQTDAAINPGNSGGALVTTDGKVIGINSAIYSQTGGSVGIGFAIPSNMVKLVVATAKAGGNIKRPWTGAQMQPVDGEVALSLNMDRPSGALIREIYPDGPLARAGLQVGDVIQSVDGYNTDDPQAVRYRFATKKLGDKVNVKFMRNGKSQQAAVAAEAPPEKPAAERSEIKGNNPFTGATIANMSPALADQMGLDTLGGKGVVIVKVVDGTPADRMQFRQGDVILQVNESEIKTVGGLKAAVAAPRPQWDFAIKRGDRVLRASVGG